MAADDWKHRTGTGPRPGRPTTGKGKGRSRVAIAVFPLLVAGGVGIGLATWVRPEPAPLLLSLPVAEYETPWPANPWARQDADGLKEALPKSEHGFIATGSQSQEGGLEREIRQLGEEAKKHSGQPLLFHLCALATTDGRTVSVQLSAPGGQDLRTPLAKVLDAIGEIPGKRLLLLDLRPVADPRLGQLGNELAPALHAELKAREDSKQLPFLVGAYSAPAEYPYVSPELGRGVFAEFLRLGLGGRADGFTGAVDKQVQAKELVAYARAWVVHWLKAHKAPGIAPTLYGTGEDFVVRAVPQNLPAWPTAVEPAAPRDEVTAAWAEVEQWRAAEAVHKYPRTFRQLQETVVAIDQAALGGGRWEQLGNNLRDRRRTVAAQRTALEPKGYPLRTVGRLVREDNPRPRDPVRPPAPKAEPKAPEAKGPDFAGAMRTLSNALRIANRAAGSKDRPVEKKETEAANAALVAAEGEFWKANGDTFPYDRTVREMFVELMKSDGVERGQENLAEYLKVLRMPTPPPDHLELAYLALVADPTVEARSQMPGELARFLLAAAVRGEEAVTVSGRGLLRMTVKQGGEKALDDADQTFAANAAQVFAESRKKWDAAARELDPLAELYRKLGDLGTAHAEAVREWQKDVALLAAIGAFAPVPRAAGENVFEARWRGLVARTGKLREVIDQQAALGKLVVATDEGQRAREDLEQALRPLPGTSPAETRARLRLPVWTPDERREWTKEADASALALATAALDEKAVRPDTSVDLKQWAPDESAKRAADHRAARAAGLFALVDPVATPVGAAALREALVDGLRKRYADAGKKAGTAAAEREKFAWLLHPADLPAAPEAGGEPADPGATLRQETDRQAAEWLVVNRYRRIAATMTAVPNRPAAAVAVAKALNRAAESLSGWAP